MILRGHDYEHIEELYAEMKNCMKAWEEDETLKNWEKVSAAFGYACFDPERDSNADAVFKSAVCILTKKR